MSELELVLRRRLQAVRKGVRIGTDTLQTAQDATGLSNERLARELHVSTKTWERWKKAGEVPVYHLDDVARELSLQIERPEGPRVRLPEPQTQMLQELAADVRELLAESREALDRLERIESMLAPDEARRRAPGSGTRPGSRK